VDSGFPCFDDRQPHHQSLFTCDLFFPLADASYLLSSLALARTGVASTRSALARE